jgi:small ligand-binding sensory domain FIST
MTIPFLRAAQASGDDWGGTVKAALTALGPLPNDANFGLVYGTNGLAGDITSILTFLKKTTPIKQWVGAAGEGVIGPLGTRRGKRALAALVATLPGESFRLFEGWQEPRRSQFLSRQRDWLNNQAIKLALLHGDAADLPTELREMSAATQSFIVGAVAETPTGGLSGVLLGAPLSLLTGLTQGCVPLGPMLRVSQAIDGVIMSLDGRPALDMLKEQADPEIARDLRRAAGIIHIGLPVAGSDRADYLVRPLRAIDPARGWLAVAGRLAVGDALLFVKRDADSARQDMRRMLADLARRRLGRAIRAGLYISCVARGDGMFGSMDGEVTMIRDCLGDFPLIGIIGQGEFCHDRLYAFTGVLVLILS